MNKKVASLFFLGEILSLAAAGVAMFLASGLGIPFHGPVQIDELCRRWLDFRLVIG